MAEHIQGELVLIHRVEEPTPTNEKSPIAPILSAQEEEIQTPKVEKETKDGKNIKKLINASVGRRAANLSIKLVEGRVNRTFDRRIFAENFSGNSRGAVRIQNQKTQFNSIVNKTKQVAGTSVTAISLGFDNPATWALIGIQAATIVSNYINEFNNFKMQLEQHNINKDREVFNSRYQINRLNYYNRRRG